MTFLLVLSGMGTSPVAQEIEARVFDASIVRRSTSGRVYLTKLTQAPDELPPQGRILLFRTVESGVSTNNAMAFRILKLYPERSELAIKKVRSYSEHDSLEVGENFSAIEKIGDRLAENIPPVENQDAALDSADLKELETPPPSTDQANVSPETQDAELDANRGSDGDDESESISEIDSDQITVNELRRLDTDKNWLSAQVGLLSGVTPLGVTSQNMVFGFRYAVTLNRDVLVKTSTVQDSLCFELSTYLYKAAGESSDTYTVLPLQAALRYNIFTGETLGAFAYAGLIKNFVVQANNGLTEAIDFQSTFGISAGIGLLYVMGPKWNLRFDFGLDMIGSGLVIRF